MTVKVSDLRQQYAKAVDELNGLINDADAFTKKEAEVVALKGQIERTEKAQALAAETALPVEGQLAPVKPAEVKAPEYPVGSYVKALYNAGGNPMMAKMWATENLGESHPVTKALSTSVAASGGNMVPEDFANQIIELLRPNTVIRSSGAPVIPMPRGTMRMGKQTSGVTGTYGAEGAKAGTQKPGTGNIVATFKKLTVLVPVSNDWLRYASPATDGLVQNDIVLGLARTEDLAFLRGDGTADWPKGLRNIVLSGNVNGSTGTSLAQIDADLTKAILALEAANVPMLKPTWFFHPRTKQALLTLKNSNGFYVYRDEMVNNGTLRGYPFKTTTQIPANLGGGSNESEVYLCDMSQALIFDALALALAMSTEGTYTAEDGSTRNAFERDETLFRAIAEHDFHLRHDEAVSVITAVQWS